jgi:hypothetical protein
MTCLTAFDLDGQVGQGVALCPGKRLDTTMGPEQRLPGLLVEELKSSFQIPSIHDEGAARIDVPQAFGMVTEGFLTAIPDVFDDVTGYTCRFRVDGRSRGTVEVGRAHPAQQTAQRFLFVVGLGITLTENRGRRLSPRPEFTS